MRQLWMAEVLKQTRFGAARLLVGGVLAMGLVTSLVLAALGVGGTHVTFLLGWPGGLMWWNALLRLAFFFAPAALMAWGVGLEQSSDTWKVVLVRAPRRWPVVLVKLAVALGWLVVLLVGSLSWLGVVVAAGHVVDAPALPVPEADLVHVAAALASAVAMLPLVLLVAVRARSGTLWGTVIGIVVPLALSLVMGSTTWLARLSAQGALEVLALRWWAGPKAIDDAAGLVGADWSSAACGAVVLAWLVLPVLAACRSLERQDVLGE